MSENQIVVILGISIVFIGLISLIILCKILAVISNIGEENPPAVNTSTTTPITTAPVKQTIENRQQIIAAVSAAVAEELGTDVSAIRILSLKKL